MSKEIFNSKNVKPRSTSKYLKVIDKNGKDALVEDNSLLTDGSRNVIEALKFSFDGTESKPNIQLNGVSPTGLTTLRINGSDDPNATNKTYQAAELRLTNRNLSAGPNFHLSTGSTKDADGYGYILKGTHDGKLTWNRFTGTIENIVRGITVNGTTETAGDDGVVDLGNLVSSITVNGSSKTITNGNVVLDDFVPLSGGTMTGALKFSYNGDSSLPNIQLNGTNCTTLTMNGSNNPDSTNKLYEAAELRLTNNSLSNGPYFHLTTGSKKGDSYGYLLEGTSDGKLTWGPSGNAKDIITVVDSGKFNSSTGNKSSSGDSWYRIYSDGWCEQGGKRANSSLRLTIKLYQECSNLTILVNRLLEYNDLTRDKLASHVTSIDTNNKSFGVSMNAFGSDFFWIAKGYIVQ